MNVKRNLLLVILIAVVAAGAVGVGLWAGSPAASCVAHEVNIKEGKVTPKTTTGKLCDTLVITNRDSTTRLIAFGNHDHHTYYDGVEERLLKRNESVHITFDQTGHFHFHDHIHDQVEGFFNVSK